MGKLKKPMKIKEIIPKDVNLKKRWKTMEDCIPRKSKNMFRSSKEFLRTLWNFEDLFRT